MKGSGATIIVGEEGKKFFAHKALLSFYSTYFERSLNSSFQEGESGEVVLFDVKPKVFQCFFNWLYNGTLFDAAPCQKADEESLMEQQQDLCYKVWIFGHRNDIPGLQNAAINALRDIIVLTWCFQQYTISFMYDETPKSAKIRRFISQAVAVTGSNPLHKLLDTSHDPLPPDDDDVDISKAFLAEVYLNLKSRKEKGLKDEKDPKRWLRELDLCPFHEHQEGQTCKQLMGDGTR